MKGFGSHSSIWTMNWTPEAAEHAVAEAVRHDFDFIEIALLTPPTVDAALSRALLDRAGLPAAYLLGLPEKDWPSHNPEGAIAFLKIALDKTAAMGCLALTGVTYGGIGERTGLPPTQTELGYVDKWRTQRRIDVMSMKSRKLSAILS